MSERRIPRAETLEGLFDTLDPRPLMSREELESFYAKGGEKIRDLDVVGEMAVRLSLRGAPYKAFLCGRTGCGKSTELSRLRQQIRGQYLVVRADINEQLDVLNFRPFDVLRLMVTEVLEKTNGLDCEKPDPGLAAAFYDWFFETKVVHTSSGTGSLTAELTAGIPFPDFWKKLLAFSASAKAEAKYASSREQKITESAMTRISELVESSNRLLQSVQAAMEKAGLGRLLIVVEGFDKNQVPREVNHAFFISYRDILNQLNCPLILTLPLDLLYSEDGSRLPSFHRLVMTDIPVYDRDDKPHAQDREFLVEILNDRMALDLMDEGCLDKAIVASGGVIRTLFRILTEAATKALVENRKTISVENLDRAISQLRVEYKGRLSTPDDEKSGPSYEQKVQRLSDLCADKGKAEQRDRVFACLLKIDALLEYNGDHWFGPHPVFVDIVQGRGAKDEPVPGGTI